MSILCIPWNISVQYFVWERWSCCSLQSYDAFDEHTIVDSPLKKNWKRKSHSLHFKTLTKTVMTGVSYLTEIAIKKIKHEGISKNILYSNTSIVYSKWILSNSVGFALKQSDLLKWTLKIKFLKSKTRIQLCYKWMPVLKVAQIVCSFLPFCCFCCCKLTVSTPMEPIIWKIDPQEGQQPGPHRIPWQHSQLVVFVHVTIEHVSHWLNHQFVDNHLRREKRNIIHLLYSVSGIKSFNR